MKEKINKKLFFFLTASLIIFLLGYAFPLNFIRNPINKIFNSPKLFIMQAKLQFFKDEKSKLVQLEKENAQILEKLSNYETLKRENEALRSQFQTQIPSHESLLPAKIVGFEGEFMSPTNLIIDKGMKDNVDRGETVVFENNLIGIITDVSANYSKVILPSNKDFSIVAYDSQTQAQGIVSGQEDFIFLEKVTITEKLNEGDLIMTKGEVSVEGIGLEPDMIIGKIVSINKKDNETFQTAKIESLVDFSSLSSVFIINSR